MVWAVIGLNAGLAENQAAFSDELRFRQEPRRVVIEYGTKSVAEFVFADDAILRPYLANIRALSGRSITRTHPPVKGLDDTDHATMHPGLWLAFGAINGDDFWRNRGRIMHEEFVSPPSVENEIVRIATRSQVVSPSGQLIGRLDNKIQFAVHDVGLMILWKATFQSDKGPWIFGDQEEMGFGARLATPLIEKNGGTVTNAKGEHSAVKTWGDSAVWCDYAKEIDGRSAGITLMSAPSNFREPWWHNRDYGLMVANPFGRHAMKQGEVSSVEIPTGQPFTLQFAACVHDVGDYQPETSYRIYLELLKTLDLSTMPIP